MQADDWKDSFLSLHPRVFLKRLERPYLYHVERDELYEIDEKALLFLSLCDGTSKGESLTTDVEFVSFCLEEGLLETHPRPSPRFITIGEAPLPSLRYLELQLLHQCNLRCRHCYLGPPRPERLSLAEAVGITREFAARGGLRLLISGGEPLLHPELPAFLDQTRDLGTRRILLTNGTLLTPEFAPRLRWRRCRSAWTAGAGAMRPSGASGLLIKPLRVFRPPGRPACPSLSPPWSTGRTWMNSTDWPAWWKRSGPLNGGWMSPACRVP